MMFALNSCFWRWTWGTPLYFPSLTTFCQRRRKYSLIKIHSLKQLQQTDWLSTKKLVTLNLYFQTISLVLYSARGLLMFASYPENHPGYVYCHFPPPVFWNSFSTPLWITVTLSEWGTINYSPRRLLFIFLPHSAESEHTSASSAAELHPAVEGERRTRRRRSGVLRLWEEIWVFIQRRRLVADPTSWCVHFLCHSHCFILLPVCLSQKSGWLWPPSDHLQNNSRALPHSLTPRLLKTVEALSGILSQS